MSVGADDMIIRVGQSSPDLHVLCLMACLSQPHMSSEAIYTGEADASSLAVLLLTADTVTLQAPTLILMTYGQVSKPPVLALALRLHCQEVNRWRQVLHRDRLCGSDCRHVFLWRDVYRKFRSAFTDCLHGAIQHQHAIAAHSMRNTQLQLVICHFHQPVQASDGHGLSAYAFVSMS